MATSLFDNIFEAEDVRGRPVPNGRVYTYKPGTTTPKATYSDEAGTIPNTNPVILNSSGKAQIYGDGEYTINVENMFGGQVEGWPKNIWSKLISGDFTLKVNTIDDLRNTPGTYQYEPRDVLGYYEPGDAGGGPTRIWDEGQAPGFYIDNNISIIVPDGGDGSSAWLFNENQPIDIRWGGAKTDGSLATIGIQNALDIEPKILIFPPNTIVKTGELEIKADINIIGTGCILEPTENAVFKVGKTLDEVSISGFADVQWNDTGTVGKEFFYNISDGGTGSIAFPSGTQYSIKSLIIENNNLSHSKVVVTGEDTISYIKNNNWTHDNTVSTAPAYLIVSKGIYDGDFGPIYIEDNIFHVYPPSGINKDIVKVGGGASRCVITGNDVKNNNPGSEAQFDVFTGGHKMRFTNNHLINTQLHRKQVKGINPTVNTVYKYDLIADNTFECEDGNLQVDPVFIIGGLWTMHRNQIVCKNTTVASTGILIDRSDVVYDVPTIGAAQTDQAAAAIISNNIIDLRGTFSESYAVRVDPNVVGGPGGYLNVTNNIVLGGHRLIQGFAPYMSVMGNIWASSSNAVGTSINAGTPSVAIGNVVDSSAPSLQGVQTDGNIVNEGIRVISAADTSPDVSGRTKIIISNGSTIVSFDNGVSGQIIYLIGSGSGATISHTASIRLNGSVPMILTADDTLTLLNKGSNVWVETGRSVL